MATYPLMATGEERPPADSTRVAFPLVNFDVKSGIDAETKSGMGGAPPSEVATRQDAAHAARRAPGGAEHTR
ncbi:hypothetical protein NL676_030747 [Syzygium grande]|nr:hypothetical protein NL676_030747 [Syzygium grande]